VTAVEHARLAIDESHSRDPHRSADGRPAELVYADRIEAWTVRLVPEADDLLRLAARCQHLERFDVPRGTFPEGRAGYLAWRRSLYSKQSARCAELLAAAGFSAADAEKAAHWVAKQGLKQDAGAQALEDAACLVFLENEIAEFADRHAEYPRDKFVDILRKTWRKMSPRAQDFALGLNLPPAIADLVKDALARPA
jgi:tRNAThr (cytosine32-N3)-methyltransferase